MGAVEGGVDHGTEPVTGTYPDAPLALLTAAEARGPTWPMRHRC
ncbi:hypothetical protein [Streptomyces roseolilacinus]|nr:hypothetical protein [Streptomyces roseolilacinus]